MRIILSLTGAVVLALSVASEAGAEVLNVNWRGSGTGGIPFGSVTRVNYTGLGAAPDDAENTTWNNLDTPGDRGNYTYENLVYSDGSAATGVSIQGNNIAGFTPDGATLALFQGQINAHHTIPRFMSIDITGLNDSYAYDVYLYSARGDYVAEKTLFTIGGNTKTAPGSSNTSTFVESVAGGPGNYVTFLAQSPIDGVLNIRLDGGSDPNVGGVWSGLQVVVVVPEPGTVAYSVTGMLGLLTYARRKRRERLR
jgi:hypothetical protein